MHAAQTSPPGPQFSVLLYLIWEINWIWASIPQSWRNILGLRHINPATFFSTLGSHNVHCGKICKCDRMGIWITFRQFLMQCLPIPFRQFLRHKLSFCQFVTQHLPAVALTRRPKIRRWHDFSQKKQPSAFGNNRWAVTDFQNKNNNMTTPDIQVCNWKRSMTNYNNEMDWWLSGKIQIRKTNFVVGNYVRLLALFWCFKSTSNSLLTTFWLNGLRCFKWTNLKR